MPLHARRTPSFPVLVVAFTLLLLLVTAIAAVPSAHAAKTETQSTVWYSVYGATAPAIRTSLDARRPGDYDAKTDWFVNWSYATTTRDDGRCVSKSWKVATRIKYTYPRWRVPASATDALKQQWTRYMSRLRLHELGHATNGRLTATRIDNTLRTTSAATCDALGTTLRATIKRHFATGNAADVAYDRRTQHGQTQGAVFP